MALIPGRPDRGELTVAIGVGVACVLYTVACLVSKSYGLSFFGIPVVVGAVVGILAPARPYATTFKAVGISLLLSIVLLREGVVCVLFSLPVVLPLMLPGAYAGSVLKRHLYHRTQQRTGAFVMLLVGLGGQLVDAATDDPGRHPVHAAVSQVALPASPEVVFDVLTAPEVSVTGPWPWFLRIGLPIPERMVIEAPGAGGRMRFDFSQGSAFARITRWAPGAELSYDVRSYAIRDLPFHITRLGRSPDYGFRAERVQDWLSLRRTTYALAATPDGGSILSRTVVWQRHLFPSLYFGWLQQTVMQAGQDRLLERFAKRIPSVPSTEESQVYCPGCRPSDHEDPTVDFPRRAGRACWRPRPARSSGGS